MSRTLTYVQAINEALHQAMAMDDSVLCFGLGTNDPKGVFGTTSGLDQAFGEHRVFDMPTSENGMTGIGIGAALNGMRPVMTHQRVDFFLLALDQLINNAAKWHYMFGGKNSVPITIRCILGRGWGQGPTHSQNLQALFAHIPGLKVVMPTTPADAKGLLLGSIFDDNPVIILEHRWLYNSKGSVPRGDFRTELGRGQFLHRGDDLTIVAMSYMTVEALKAVRGLEACGIGCDLIDLRTVKPLDWQMIFTSVAKTGRLLVLDTGVRFGSIAGEIVAEVSEHCFDKLKVPPKRLALPDHPEPTSFALTKGYYNSAPEIVSKASELLGKELSFAECMGHGAQHGENATKSLPHDVPGEWFKGPF